ncbi:hypothetical protein [Sphingobium sp.]|jgi:hypothetical protein|uniref:hypothetical protein n=1 Tax=Sphingobium sp. TaxID=1912891 RepID=UPI002D803E48|nr:hypothetical protein [Sphingobium sp.]
MTKTLEEFRATFTPAQRKTIDARAAELIAEEMTLSDLWRARKLTQDRDLPKLRRRRGKGMGAVAGH